MTKLYGNDSSFSDYMEPNAWRENYKPFADAYMNGATSPIVFDRPPEQPDYMAQREQIVQEELDINRIICPIQNIKDPNILYTCSQAIIDQDNRNEPKSIFTIKDEN